MFNNTSNSLIIEIPKDMNAPSEPNKNDFIEKNDYLVAVENYEVYRDLYKVTLSKYSKYKAEIKYVE